MAYKNGNGNGMVCLGAATIAMMFVLFYVLFGYMKKSYQERPQSARTSYTP